MADAAERAPGSGLNIQISPFGGTDDESFDQFEKQVLSTLRFAKINDDADKRDLLQLHLTGDAQSFYQTLPGDQVDTFEHAVDALKAQFVNPDRKEHHRIVFMNRRFKEGKENVRLVPPESPEDGSARVPR